MSDKSIRHGFNASKSGRNPLLAAAISSLLAATAQAQTAKPADASQLEEIVITGYRASLQSALNAKRESIQPIESISAEDIGKMPDQNVAESLQRLPGVQINRAGGKGTQVLIDGLSNNLITLNGDVFLTGKEFYVSGEAAGGGNGGNVQYASLEGIPSEEIGGIDVIKNPTAADREGGLGGTVNLKTRSALAQPEGLSLSGNVRGTKASGAEGGVTPVVTMVGGYKFSDRLAITGSLSYDEQKTHDKQFQDQNRNQWIVTNAAQIGSYAGSPAAGTLSTMPNGQYYINPQLAYFSDILQQVKTKGATLGAEWLWSDAIKSTFNYFYVREEDESFTYSNKAWFNGQGAAPGSLLPGIDPSQPYAVDGNGVVQNASFMANGAETATLYQNTISKSNNVQFNTVFDGDGRFSGDTGVSYAKATSNLQAAQADIEHGAYGAFNTPGFIAPTAPGCNNGGSSCDNGNHGYTFNWNNGGTSGLPSVSYPNKYGVTDVLSNPAYTVFKSNWAWANLTDEKNLAFKGNLHFTLNPQITLSSGVRYATRDVDQTFGRYLIDGSGTLGLGGVGAGTAAGNCCIAAGQSGTYLYYSDPGYATIPYSSGASNPDLIKYYNNFASGLIAVKDPHVGGMTNPSTYLNTLWTQAGVPNNTEALFVDTLSSFRVKEKTSAFYLMADSGDEAATYHANFGVRVVRTQLTVDGGQTAPVPTFSGTASWNGVNSNNLAFRRSRSYVDILPSVNFVLNVTEEQKLRFGAARVMAPQNLMQLGLGNAYGYTRGADGPGGQPRFQFNGGSSGNPNLDPFRASQFNLSWENYFRPGALISVGFFYKSVDNFVVTANIPTRVADDFGGTTANVTTPINAGKGKIYGAEIGAQYAFENGFGAAANYTRSNSDSDQTTAFESSLPIPGVSKDSFNLTVYYEHHGLSARAAYSWRSSALNSSLVGSTFSFADQNGNQKVYGVYAAAYGQLDGQVGYDFSPRVGVLLSVVNATNSKQHTYLQWENLPFTYDDTGRRYFFGVKAKL
jgi:TonB-dependent receptor